MRDAQFWLEFKEIDASEFEGLSAALNAAKSELETLENEYFEVLEIAEGFGA